MAHRDLLSTRSSPSRKHRRTSPKLINPSAFSVCEVPFFVHPVGRTPRRFAFPSRSSVPGFGYPFHEITPFAALKAYFSLQRSWASLFRAFLLSVGRNCLSATSLRPCTSSKGHYNQPMVLRRLDPNRKAVPHLGLHVLHMKPGHCSLEPFGLPGSPVAKLDIEHLPLHLPSRSFYPFLHRKRYGQASGS